MTHQPDFADLHRGMISEFLNKLDLRYLRDQDGDYVVQFKRGSRTVQFLIATDPTGSLVWFEAKASASFSIDQMPLLLVALNSYATVRRWPRLKVAVDGAEASIIADGHLVMNESLDQDELSRFLGCGLMATIQFWDEFDLPNVGSLDAEIISFLQGSQDGAA